MDILFFGSTEDSVIVLEKVSPAAVVTQPARPVGRHGTVTPTPVETWARGKNIPSYSFRSSPDKPWEYLDEKGVVTELSKLRYDLVVSASYGQKIPSEIIGRANGGALNVHPSLLPRWRGGDPVPWAILCGDRETGVSVVTLGERFDQGKILAQERVPITDTDTSGPLRMRLFEIGAGLLFKRTSPEARAESYARRFTRDDGFIPWELLKKAQEGSSILPIGHYRTKLLTDYTKYQTDWKNERSLADLLHRFYRALHPWPGIWTTMNGKRMKILSCHKNNTSLVFDSVQIEGKKPVAYAQFASAYLPSP